MKVERPTQQLDTINGIWKEHLEVAKMLPTLASAVSSAVDLICSSLAAGGQLLIAGNGGSAADAQHIAAELTGDTVTTSVADRGPGIDDFEQTMIFDKFYRGKDQRYLVHGTGMGLPIAKAIIAAQQGNVSVTSQLGHGSVFSFTLPVDRDQKDAW